jgi:signal peptide peptidase SppA
MAKLLDIVNAPWALPAEKLDEIVAIYCAHVRGEKIDLAAIEARIGRPLAAAAGAEQHYDIVDGVAVVAIDGVLSKRMNLMSQISGGASTELIGRNVQEALADPRVHAILIEIDSPGGSVDGTEALAEQIYAARGVKPVISWGADWMTSGAYWIGAAAEAVYIAGATTITGSIGVRSKHVDTSGMQEKMGVKTTDIYSGKYKAMGSENGPLTDEAKAYLQSFMDQLYTVFVDSVARYRGVSSDTVLTKMADGKMFVGRAAIEAGLVDGVSTREALIADLVSGAKPVRSKA